MESPRSRRTEKAERIRTFYRKEEETIMHMYQEGSRLILEKDYYATLPLGGEGDP